MRTERRPQQRGAAGQKVHRSEASSPVIKLDGLRLVHQRPSGRFWGCLNISSLLEKQPLAGPSPRADGSWSKGQGGQGQPGAASIPQQPLRRSPLFLSPQADALPPQQFLMGKSEKKTFSFLLNEFWVSCLPPGELKSRLVLSEDSAFWLPAVVRFFLFVSLLM